jgi:hypothetical protein
MHATDDDLYDDTFEYLRAETFFMEYVRRQLKNMETSDEQGQQPETDRQEAI